MGAEALAGFFGCYVLELHFNGTSNGCVCNFDGICDSGEECGKCQDCGACPTDLVSSDRLNYYCFLICRISNSLSFVSSCCFSQPKTQPTLHVTVRAKGQRIGEVAKVHVVEESVPGQPTLVIIEITKKRCSLMMMGPGNI